MTLETVMKTQAQAMLDKIPDAPAIKSALIATLASASGSVGASMADWNWTAIIACATAVATAAANIWFARRRDRREQEENRMRQEESRARIAALRGRCSV